MWYGEKRIRFRCVCSYCDVNVKFVYIDGVKLGILVCKSDVYTFYPFAACGSFSSTSREKALLYFLDSQIDESKPN